MNVDIIVIFIYVEREKVDNLVVCFSILLLNMYVFLDDMLEDGGL